MPEKGLEILAENGLIDKMPEVLAMEVYTVLKKHLNQ
jgi:hypothetical protein